MSSPAAGIDPSTYHPLPPEQATAPDPCMMLPYSYRGADAQREGGEGGGVQKGPSSALQPDPPDKGPRIARPHCCSELAHPPPCALRCECGAAPQKGPSHPVPQNQCCAQDPAQHRPPAHPHFGLGVPDLHWGDPVGRRRGAGMAHTWKESSISTSSVKSGFFCPVTLLPAA